MPRRIALALIAAWMCAGCSGDERPAPAPVVTQPASQAAPIRVLMLTATLGFRHDSIPAARDAMNAMAASSGEFTVTATEDVSSITATTLSGYDVIFFALTTG